MHSPTGVILPQDSDPKIARCRPQDCRGVEDGEETGPASGLRTAELESFLPAPFHAQSQALDPEVHFLKSELGATAPTSGTIGGAS